MKIARIPELLSLLAKILAFFSFSSHEEKLELFPKSTNEIKHAYVLSMLFALSLFIVAVFLRGSSKQSSEGEDCRCHSILFTSILELYPLSYKVDEEILHETCSLTNIVNEDDQEFIPSLVHLKLIEGATGNHEFGDKDLISHSVEGKLVVGAIRSDEENEEFHGYDGYDEDNDDEGDEDDVDSSIADDVNDYDDLTTRIEEFIAMNVRKWKEEMLNDKLLYLDY